MSIGLLIVSASIWIFLLWAIAIKLVSKSKSLEAAPMFWLSAICSALGAPLFAVCLSIFLPQSYANPFALESIGTQIQTTSLIFEAVPIRLTYFLIGIYAVGIIAGLYRIIIPYLALVRLTKSKPNHFYKNIPTHYVSQNIPPCSFGIMRPSILIPRAFIAKNTALEINMVLAHEYAHIARHDQRIYLFLLIVKTLTWPHLAIVDMINRWSIATEIRADNFALKNRGRAERKIYGELLLSTLRKKDGGALPCPSATLHLSNYRSTKMRVNNIMNPKHYTGKGHSKKMGAALLIALFCGATAMSAIAREGVPLDINEQPLVRVPPMFPLNCPLNEGKFSASVSVKFDVDKAGNVHNISVTKSDNACFNKVSTDSVLKWKYKPRKRKLKNVETMVRFIATS